ncbi:MAG: flippase-like domain-containing protein [Acidimicrobiia bacterium]|nr:flippase-like domain-containing protein [Acidimicrobiia bacterium]
MASISDRGTRHAEGVSQRPMVTHDATSPPAMWAVGRVLIVASLLAFGVATFFAARPVVNPGVQDCGAPLAYIVTNTADAEVPPAAADPTVDAPRLRSQPPCSRRVAVELTRAGMATATGVALGVVGVMLGLLDDRLARRRAPRFESLVRPRPTDAPTRAFDPVPTRPEDLAGDRLPPAEPIQVVVLVLAFPATLAVALWLTAEGAARPSVPWWAWLLAAPLAGGTRAAAAGARRPLRDSGPFEDRLRVAVSAGWLARARPELTTFGCQVRRQIRRGASLERALGEAGVLAAAALVVHGTVLVLGGVAVWRADDLAWSVPEGRWAALAAVMAGVVVVGASRARRQVRALAISVDRSSWAALADPARRPLAVHALGGAVVQFVAELAVLWLLVEAAGGEVPLVVLAWLWAVTVAVANVGDVTPGGAGVAEGALAVLLVLVGVAGPVAVVVAVATRLVTFWIPCAVGAVASRWWPVVTER